MKIFLLFCLSVLQLPGIATALPGQSTCYQVSSDSIHARDLSQAVPEFSGLPPDLSLGFAPEPGMQRVFHVYELRRIAKEHHIEADEIRKNVCVAWSMETLSGDRMLGAMQTSLVGHQPIVEILAQSKAPVPAGSVFFPLQGLSAVSDKPVIWNGYIAYAANRKFSIWALVRIRVCEQHLVALRVIRRGEPIHSDYFAAATYEGPMLRDGVVSDLSQSAQLSATRDIAQGATLLSTMVALPSDVQRGDAVTVIVDSGAAHLETQGIAVQTGSLGEVILVKNVRSGRSFKGRVIGKGRVAVDPGISCGLAVEEKKS